jgi:CRISPR type III-B/RAMP module RAMP protein Cmr6
MSQIPITKDYAGAVGKWCEKVESRSLLHEKFAFPKNWGEDVKENSASYWSIMRIATNGSGLLNNAKRDLERRATGRNVNQQNAENMRLAAQVCGKLANTKTGSNLEPLRPQHSERFLALLRQTYSENRLRVLSGRLEGRLAINLAEGLIQNAGMALDRIFGLPFIPGSAVKGVTRHAALEELAAETDTAKRAALLETIARIFGIAESDYKKGEGKNKDGTPKKDGDLFRYFDLLGKTNLSQNEKGGIIHDLKGAITFIQATPTNDARIVVDITNVHTPDYYQWEGLQEKIKKEENFLKKQKLEHDATEALKQREHPTPNYFPAVERGAEFAFPILLNSMSNDVKLLETAERWLQAAMEQHGFGAKTAAGYGWFTDLAKEKQARDEQARIARQEEDTRRQAEIDERQKIPIDTALVQELSSLDASRLRQKLDGYCVPPQNWKTPESEQRSLLEVPRLKTIWQQNKANPAARISRAIKNLADKFGVQLP